MAEKKCSSMLSSVSSMNDRIDHEKKDVSKVFSLIRAKLNAKEKELLELQRAEPSLLAPDPEQIENLFNVISSIQLSTLDGSFLFPSTVENRSSSSSVVPSTGVQRIKTLPTNVWLTERNVKNEDETPSLRLPLVSQLFSMPAKAFVASSSPSVAQCPSPVKSVRLEDDPPARLPMVTELLSMPLDAFKPSNKRQPASITTVPLDPPKPTPIVQDETKVVSQPETVKSILDGNSVYSKDFWLKKPQSSTTTNDESVPFDIEKYIQQTSEKMRRLHLDYVSALNQLQSPPAPLQSTSAIKSVYPQVFERIQGDLPHRGRCSAPPSSTK